MKKPLLFVLLITLATIANAKDKIAVFPFTNTVGEDFGSTKVSESEMAKTLVGINRFDVIERAQLETIVKEQALNLTGAVNVDQIVNVGKISGIRYGVLGTLTNVSFKVDTVFNNLTEERQPEVKAIIVIDLKIVDVETATLVFSKSYKEEPEEGWGAIFGQVATDPRKRFLQMIEKIFKEKVMSDILKTFPIEGGIFSIDTKEKTVIIDIGKKDGVKKGMEFEVILQEQKENPRTQKMITIEKKVGKVKVKDDSAEDTAICKISKGLENIKEGMLIRLKVD